jgi:branched-chain amino acid transport system ATP-binding protein
MLAITDVHAHYGYFEALHGVSAEVGDREIVTLLGANGAGKTTLVSTVMGLMRPTRGSIVFDGDPIARLRTDKIVRRGIALVPERRELFSELSVYENLYMGSYTRRNPGEIGRDFEMVYSYFPKLRERSRQLAATLSGGEQQMLAIGRALMSRPRLLLLDEPSLGLSPIMITTIFDVLKRINTEAGVALFLIEQNTNIALSVATRGYVLESGRIVAHDTTAALSESKLVRESYLGAA